MRGGRRSAWVGCVLAAVLAAGGLPAVEPSPPVDRAAATEDELATTPDAELAFALEQPGRALRAAIAAIDAGQRERAEALLRGVSERHPIVADHADLLRMRLRVEQRDFEAAVALEPLWTKRDSPLRGRFYDRLGDAHRELGDETRARAAWEFAALETRDRARLAALELAIAESLLRERALEPAAERLVAIWTRRAGLSAARRAERHLETLERELGRTLRGATPTRRRADELFDRYQNEAALDAYDRALELGLEGSARRHALHRRAETLFRLRRYPEAIRAYQVLPASDEREIQVARAKARSGRVAEGAGELEKLAASRRGSDAVRAQYLAALLWDGENESQRARRLFAGVIERAPKSSYAVASHWWLGWDDFRAGRYEEAARRFEQLTHLEADPISALRPRYWAIRVREERGDPDVAARYAALAGEWPFTYYGFRALERSRGEAAPHAVQPIAPGRSALAPDDLARPRILVEAGLRDAAREELARLARRARGLDDRLALADLGAEAGAFDLARSVIGDAYTETLARGPSPDQLVVWWHAWPAPYDGELAEATRSGRPSAALVYSIMREESGYQPEVVSVAGARGLLQLMPATATKLAAQIGLAPFDPDDLFRPAVNIRLGSRYLGQLLERFDGHSAAAIGSYNAGPEAVTRWLRGDDSPEDVWVEQIPYTETRAYVKRVLRSLHVYRVLY